MKCEKIMNDFLELENYSRLPLIMRVHMLFCKNCRNEMQLLLDTFDYLEESNPYNMKRDLTESIMAQIYRLDNPYKRTVSNFNWIAAGSFILFSIFLLPFNNSFTWLKSHFGGNLEIPLTIVMGVAITIYASLFAGTHLESFQYREKIERFIHRIIP